tara:strand:- start:223 stop:429 length:207 start_codon:yes stop_codon:yes gene_type:complete
MYETIYSDSEGREILIIALLDAYFMAKRAPPPWVGLTDEEVSALQDFAYADDVEFVRHIEAKLKEKNT